MQLPLLPIRRGNGRGSVTGNTRRRRERRKENESERGNESGNGRGSENGSGKCENGRELMNTFAEVKISLACPLCIPSSGFGENG